MDPEVREHAHEPFFTTKPPGEASGLGLATVDGIVKQAGGSVEVYSEVGVGTSVKIFLPVAAGGARRAPRDDGNEDGAGRKVLVVEDQESVRKLTCRILADRDFEVLETADPEQALALVAGAGVDLLLTDVIMPEMSGRDLADRAVALDPRLRVLYMSGYSADFVATSGVIEQGVCLVEKPFTAAVLLGAVRNALDDS
jgi:CheY-like chemotaxis protein